MKKCYWGRGALAVLISAAFGTTACGKSEHNDPGDTGEEPRVSLEVDGSKRLNDLDRDETEAFCKGFFGYIEEHLLQEDSFKASCLVSAASASDSVSECEDYAESCNEVTEIDAEYFDDAATSCTENFDAHGCDLTVEQVEACLNDQAAQLDALAAIDSCDDAFEANVDDLNSEPASCELLDERCPDVDVGVEEDDVPIEEPTSSIGGATLEGTIDGEPVSVSGNQVLINYTIDNSGWSRKVGFGGAELWFWQKGDSASGALRLPTGPGASSTSSTQFICIDTFELSGTREEGETFKASGLSRLSCSNEGGGPLALSYQFGYEVSLDLEGEQVDLQSNSLSYGSGSAEFGFTDSSGASWTLTINGSVTEDIESAFSSSRLVKEGDGFGVACGGGGTVLITKDDVVDISIENMGALQECPGEPVDGELSGEL